MKLSKRIIAGSIIALLPLGAGVALAEGGKDSSRIEKLEMRVREVETRVAQLEADSHKQAANMMQHHKMPGKGMAGSPNPMGMQPQGNQAMPQQPAQGGGMMDDAMEMPPMGSGQQPMGNAPQGGMPQGGGMGDM